MPARGQECVNMENKIINIVAKLVKIPKEELDLNSDIFESNIISSLGLLELIAKMEKEFGITILPEELIHENFETIKVIIKFIEKKVTANSNGTAILK